VEKFGMHLLYRLDIPLLRTRRDKLHPWIFCRGASCYGQCCLGLFRDAIGAIDRCLDFFAKCNPRHDVHAGGKFQLVNDREVLRFGHNHHELFPLRMNRENAASLGHSVWNHLQNIGINFDFVAIDVGDVGNLFEGGAEIVFADQAALEHQLTQVDKFAALVLNRFGEVGGRDMASFA
jgi:hypothetical protein